MTLLFEIADLIYFNVFIIIMLHINGQIISLANVKFNSRQVYEGIIAFIKNGEITGYAGATITSRRERESKIYQCKSLLLHYVGPRIIQCHVPGGGYPGGEEAISRLFYILYFPVRYLCKPPEYTMRKCMFM